VHGSKAVSNTAMARGGGSARVPPKELVDCELRVWTRSALKVGLTRFWYVVTMSVRLLMGELRVRPRWGLDLNLNRCMLQAVLRVPVGPS
jgi:hypothetical protein